MILDMDLTMMNNRFIKPDWRNLSFEDFSRFIHNMALVRPQECAMLFMKKEVERASMCCMPSYKLDEEVEHREETKREGHDLCELRSKKEYEEDRRIEVLERLEKLRERTLYKLFLLKSFKRKELELTRELADAEENLNELERQIAREENVYDNGGGDSESRREEIAREEADKMVRRCVEDDISGKKDHDVELYLRDLYESGVVNLIMFLYERADKHTQHQFDSFLLDDMIVSHYAIVKIVVRKNSDKSKVRGNSGRYLIYTCKGDEEPELMRFMHQASAVYYLMNLIDCYKKGRWAYPHELEDMDGLARFGASPAMLRPLDLRDNKDVFCELYCKVYDIDTNTLNERYHNLLYREDGDGRIRSGRLKELTYDINKRFGERFREYDENPKPYTIGDNHHLMIPRHLIRFECGTEELLELNFV